MLFEMKPADSAYKGLGREKTPLILVTYYARHRAHTLYYYGYVIVYSMGTKYITNYTALVPFSAGRRKGFKLHLPPWSLARSRLMTMPEGRDARES